MSEIQDDLGEIEIINDGQGMVFIGNQAVIESFLGRESLLSREVDLPRWQAVVGNTSAVNAGAINSVDQIGRWVKVTENSARIMKGANLMKGSSDGVSRAIVVGSKSKSKHIIEIVKNGKGVANFTNPAALAGVAGIMTQIALQQAMQEITDYLQVIDAKVNDVLAAQKDAVIADMLGVGLVVEEALTLREQVGKVSEVTWSKVQGIVFQLAKAQAYALLQLDGIVTKLEKEGSIATLLKTVQSVEKSVEDWLIVLARCTQLQDAIAVIELDRLLLDAADDLEDHRAALSIARDKRLEMISATISRLRARLDGTVEYANSKLLLNPFESPAIIVGCNKISAALGRFQEALELERDNEEFLSRIWGEVAVEFRDDVLKSSKKLSIDAANVSLKAAKKSAGWIGSKIPRGKSK